MKLCSMHSPWMMSFTQGTPTSGGTHTTRGLGATTVGVQSPWTWIPFRRGTTLPPDTPGVPTRNLVSVISVDKLGIGPMSVGPLRLIRWDKGVPDTARAKARTLSRLLGLVKKWRSMKSHQKTRRWAAAPLCPPRRNHSRRCSWH